jgi:hypothetical protein
VTDCAHEKYPNASTKRNNLIKTIQIPVTLSTRGQAVKESDKDSHYASLSNIQGDFDRHSVREICENARTHLTRMIVTNIGVKRLYHATSRKAGASIYDQKKMLAGRNGMFGAGIYFAETKEVARLKSRNGPDIIVTSDVNMGRALVLESPSNSMTLARLHFLGCNSIQGRSSPRCNWEFVVFESWRVTLVSVEGSLPFLSGPQSPRIKPFLPRNGALNGIIAHLTRQCGGNVDDCNVVKVTSSTPHCDDYAGRNAASFKQFLGCDYPNWICYDFRGRTIVPTHYSVRCARPWALKNWVIETSMTGECDSWKRIDRRRDNSDLRDTESPRTFEVSNSEQCRFIRLVQSGPTWCDDARSEELVAITAWEIFGSLSE